MITCEETRELISLYIDEQLDDKLRASFEEHMKECGACSRELDEMLEIVGACRDTEDAELPEGFQQQLHARLLLASEEEKLSRDTGILRIKRLRMVSSIAAGVLLVFLAGLFYSLGVFNGPMAGHTGALNSAASAREPSSVQKKAAASAESAPYSGGNGQAAGNAALDDIQAPAANTENDRSDTGGRPMQALFAPAAAAEPALKHTALLTITGDSTDKLLADIRDIAAKNGGEENDTQTVTAPNTMSIAADTTKDTSAAGTTADKQVAIQASQSQTDITLTFSIPNSQYDSFTKALAASLGESSMQYGPTTAEDLTQKLDGLIKQEEAQQSEIEKLGGSKDPKDADKLDQLKKDKASTDAEIEKIRLGSDFTQVTVVLRKKE